MTVHGGGEASCLVIANWKMNGTLDSVQQLVRILRAGLAEGTSQAEVVICPPYVYLPELSGASEFALGAQDVSDLPEGPHTGEVCAAMLKDYNCSFVIVGHSERRRGQGESDALVARKFSAALRAGLTPVLCVGEGVEARDAGRTREVILRQLDAVLGESGVEAVRCGVVAYEPVWAIGTGRSAAPETAAAVHALIRERMEEVDPEGACAARIIYGGSVSASNIRELLDAGGIDGVLVGGASLCGQEFLSICSAA